MKGLISQLLLPMSIRNVDNKLPTDVAAALKKTLPMVSSILIDVLGLIITSIGPYMFVFFRSDIFYYYTGLKNTAYSITYTQIT